MKKLHLLPWLALAFLVMAFVPSMTNFNPDQFPTTGTQVSIKSGVLLTNPVVNTSIFLTNNNNAEFEILSLASGFSFFNVNSPAVPLALIRWDAAIFGSNVVSSWGAFTASHGGYTGNGFTNTAATAGTVAAWDSGNGIGSIPTGTGVLTNNGTGVFGWRIATLDPNVALLNANNAFTGNISVDSAHQFSGNGGGLTNLGTSSLTVTATNFVLNTVYTNTSGDVAAVRGVSQLTIAAVTGRASLDLMVDQSGGNTFTLKSQGRVDTTIAVTLAGVDYQEAGAWLSTNATYYWTNSSTGAGNAGALVAGTGQYVTGIGGAGPQGAAGATGPQGPAGGNTQGGVQTNSILQATNIIGLHDSICIPAGAFFAQNLAALTATNAIFTTISNICEGWIFSDAITNEVRTRFSLPYDWDGGTVQVQLSALCTGTNADQVNQTNVVFGVAAAALPPQADISSQTFGTQIWVTNRINRAAYVEGNAVTTPITVGNSPNATKSILWQIQRLGAQGGDTLTNASLLLTEVRVFFTRNLTTTNAPTSSP